MKILYQKIENLWFLLVPEKLRFLLVGGFNTLSSYLLFAMFVSVLSYAAALVITYVLAINLSILTMRHYVFRAKTNFLKQYYKSGTTYILMLVFNYLFLWICIDILSIHPLISQALFTLISTILLYYIHKNFNFLDCH